MIVVDSSVVVSILRSESDAELLTDVLDKAPKALMSVVSYVETNLVIAGRSADAGPRIVDAMLRALHIDVVPVTMDQGRAAVTAFLKYGKGRHPARLNISDCFTYGLAKTRNLALLYRGEDFLKTDIVAAWRP